MEDYYLIKTVIGFRLKNTITLIPQEDGSVKEYVGGIKSTYTPEEALDLNSIKTKHCDTKWFTNFNQKLLDKIRNYQKINE